MSPFAPVSSLGPSFRHIARSHRELLDAFRRRRVARRSEWLAGDAPGALGPRDLVVVCVVRDGALHVPSFVAHHRRLGARHVVFLDNGSRDDTVAIARAQGGDVSVLGCPLPYRTHQYAMRRFLVERFGRTSWCLVADVDERFDYPGSDRLPLPRFLDYLNERGYSAVAAQMLDLLPPGPPSAWPADGSALEAESRFCDLADVERLPWEAHASNRLADPTLPLLSGGVRRGVFGLRGLLKLTKLPLLFAGRGARPAPDSAHRCLGAHVADVSALLRHYKFDRGFPERCRAAVREGQYWNRSTDYRQYLRALERDPALTLLRPTARRLRSLDELVEADFLRVSPAYRDFVRRAGGPPGEGASAEAPDAEGPDAAAAHSGVARR